MIRVICIDDNEAVLESLENLMETLPLPFKVIGTATDVDEAVEIIDKLKPDLITLDMELPKTGGFSVLDRVSFKDFEVVVISAFEEFSFEAYQYDVLHYIKKPFESEILYKIYEKLKKSSLSHKLNIKHQLFNSKYIRYPVRCKKEVKYIDINFVTHIESYGNYAKFHFIDKSILIADNNLNHYSSELELIDFLRIHKRYSINLYNVERFLAFESLFLMKNKIEIPISRRKKDDIKRLIKLKIRQNSDD